MSLYLLGIYDGLNCVEGYLGITYAACVSRAIDSNQLVE